jgi:dihydroneopterin aldolase
MKEAFIIPAFIGFENKRIHCIIGCLESERGKEQELAIDLKVKSDISKCAFSDQIDDAVNYVLLADLCQTIAQKGHFHLLEALAWKIIDEIFAAFPVLSVWIRIKKHGAIPSADCSFIELERYQKELPCAGH